MKKKALALTVLLLSVVFIILSVSLLLNRAADQADPLPSDRMEGSVNSAEKDSANIPMSAPPVCDHVMSAEWSHDNGSHFHKCVMPDCSYIEDEAPCSGGHASCSKKAVCQVCNMPYGDTAEHTWSSEWDYSDIDGHAHTCTFGCGTHDELQPHVPGPAATEQSPQICLDCNFVIADTLEHIHTLKKIAASEASCMAYGSIEYYSCTGCSKLFYDAEASDMIENIASIRVASLGHDFADPTCTKAKTCQRDGCNAVEGQPLGHSPASAWHSDANGHWQICSVCGERVNHTVHTPGPAATEQTPQLCTVCNFTLQTPVAHSHNFGGAVKFDSDSHWYECFCGQTNGKQNHTDTNRNGKCDICGYQMPTTQQGQTSSGQYTEEIGKMETILQPAQITLLRPEASGVLTKSNASAIIDYSNHKDGYVMVKYTENTTVKLKVQVQGATTTYTYNLRPHEWAVLPLTDGNGNYNIKVFKNVVDNRYSAVLSLKFTASLSDEFSPFLRPNQYVNFEHAVNTMNKAAELSAGKSDTLEKVKAIYNYIITNISYDYQKAATVQSGYLPDLDQVLATKKGICFDYAALMAGMLRSQNIACKLIVGYADTAYHAWISVWTPDKGWIDGAIFFDGIKWQLMDPTYASSSGSEIINKVTYTSKYIY